MNRAPVVAKAVEGVGQMHREKEDALVGFAVRKDSFAAAGGRGDAR
jgi:hypothetical protein